MQICIGFELNQNLRAKIEKPARDQKMIHSNPIVEFDKEAHIYRINGVVYPSVGQTISSLKPAFDSQSVSNRIAERDGLDQSQLLAQWNKKRDDACDSGHRLHDDISEILSGHRRGSYTLNATNSWIEWWESAKQALSPIAVEQIVFDQIFQVAGTVDAVFYSKKTKLHHVFDWKQNGKFNTTTRFGSLLTPFNDLADNHISVYSIQASFYRLIIERNSELRFGESWILHVGEVVTPYKAIDLRTRIAQWMEHLNH